MIGCRPARVSIALLGLVAVAAGAVEAQPRSQRQSKTPPATPRSHEPFRARSLQLAVGVAFASGTDFGDTRATLTSNETPPGRYTLFETDSTLGSAAGFEGRLGYMVTRSFGVEGAFLYARPRLETRISGDVEGAPAVTAVNDISQYLIDVSGVYRLHRLRFSRGVPFVLGGGGYLRQLDEDLLLVETGRTVHAGGGFTYLFFQRPRGLIRGLALRADGRLYVRTGGYELNDEISRRTFGTVTGSLAVTF
jgi:hypothetical protein